MSRVKKTQPTNKYEFSIVNLQEDNEPIASIQRNKEWVGYGTDQRLPTGYFNYINYLYKNSSLNYALISGIADRIYGQGLFTHSRDKVGLAKFKAVFNKEEQKKFILDVYEQGNGALQLTTDRAGRVVEVEHMPINTLLPNKADEDGVIPSYWYSANWDDLQLIIHIGPVRADEIISMRSVRKFTSVDGLDAVDGIGPSRLRDIKAQNVACVN